MQMCPFCDKVYDESEYCGCPYCSGELDGDVGERPFKNCPKLWRDYVLGRLLGMLKLWA